MFEGRAIWIALAGLVAIRCSDKVEYKEEFPSFSTSYTHYKAFNKS
jgi:hypothetical protein